MSNGNTKPFHEIEERLYGDRLCRVPDFDCKPIVSLYHVDCTSAVFNSDLREFFRPIFFVNVFVVRYLELAVDNYQCRVAGYGGFQF